MKKLTFKIFMGIFFLCIANYLYSQTLYVLSSSGFTNPAKLVDQTSNYTYANSPAYFAEIIVVCPGNYIETLTLSIGNSNYGYELKIYISEDNQEYTLFGEGYTNNTTQDISIYSKGRYVKIKAQKVSDFTPLIELIELTAKCYQYKTSYTYDNSGNRISRSIAVTLLKSAYEEEKNMQTPEEEKLLSEQNVKIYPNPTRGELKIAFLNFPESRMVEANLYNSNGTLLLQDKFISGNSILSIDDYPPGHYILKLISGDDVQSFEIIKN